MSTWYDLTETYWTQPLAASQASHLVVKNPPVLENLREALEAGHTARREAEWNLPHMAAYNAGEISRLKMWMRRPPVFFVASIWEIMEYGYSGGEFPTALVEAYIEHNGDIWPMLEEAGFTRGAENHRAWSSYEDGIGSVR